MFLWLDWFTERKNKDRKIKSDAHLTEAYAVAEFIKNDLEHSNLLNKSNNKSFEEFYVSSNPNKFRESSKMFYNFLTGVFLFILRTLKICLKGVLWLKRLSLLKN